MKEQAIGIVFETDSPEETENLGAALGKLLEAGSIVTLSGELGGGKTCFVRGIVASLAPQSCELVASPTFAILHEYPGNTSIMHYDCYRLKGSDDAIELGLEDQLHGSGICLIEWPDRISDILPDNYLEVLFEYAGDTTRRITFTPHGSNLQAMLKQLVAAANSTKYVLSAA